MYHDDQYMISFQKSSVQRKFMISTKKAKGHPYTIISPGAYARVCAPS